MWQAKLTANGHMTRSYQVVPKKLKSFKELPINKLS